MSVRVRLTRVGSKKNPIWRVVVADQRSPRDGRFIETIGHYNPQTQPSTIRIDEERFEHWVARGAQPTGSVKKLMQAQARSGPSEIGGSAVSGGGAVTEQPAAEPEAGAADGELSAGPDAGADDGQEPAGTVENGDGQSHTDAEGAAVTGEEQPASLEEPAGEAAESPADDADGAADGAEPEQPAAEDQPPSPS